MPSLAIRPDRSEKWICCYRNADGTRCQKSTGQTEKAKAWEVCLSIERAERFAKEGTLTEQIAKKIIGEMVERTTGQAMHTATAEAWINEWKDGKAQTKSASTAERYKQVTRDFLKSLGRRAKLSLAHITSKDLHTYRNEELAEGKAPKTANLSVKVISAAFNAALRQGYITNNPCTALESLPEEAAQRSTFTPAQIGKLIAAADGDWKGAILLAYFTGARLRDVANMRWDSIDRERQLITFTPSKTKKPVTIPFHSEIESHLLKTPGIGKAFLFPSLAGRGTGGKTGLSGQFGAIMEKSGIVGKITRHTKEGRANNSLSFHSLRHSFNSAMANAGVSQEIRQKLTGHASAAMNKHYTHHELEPLRAAIGLIPSLSAGGGSR